jgi:hypothetical protein
MPIRRKTKVRWWRGCEVYIAVAVFWYAVLGLWLALLTGVEATGSRIPMNPITADYEVLTGHLSWPHGWANALLVIETFLLVAALWLVRRILVDRVKRSAPE